MTLKSPPCLLVTRPQGQGQSLCEKLQSAGYGCHHVPVMQIDLPRHSAERDAIHSCFSKLAHYRGLVFVSLNAAEQALPWLASFPLQASHELFAVGQSTADYLQQKLQRRVFFPAQQMDSEGLLALPALQAAQVAGQHYLLLRGEGGRELIASTLQARGASVDSCVLYRRSMAASQGRRLRDLLPQVTVILINSAESLEYFLAMANDSVNKQQYLLVPSERVAQYARSAGFQHIITAANATDTAILEAVRRAFPAD